MTGVDAAGVSVVFVDEELLVVDKPAGLHCHPLDDATEDTLLSRVARAYPEVRAPAFPARDGALLHRLDHGTTGLVAFARTLPAYSALRARFSDDDGGIEKLYVALVDGLLARTIEETSPIAHHPKSKAKMVVVAGRARHRSTPRAASTRFAPIARGEDCTLVACALVGGRRHQIRVHAAHIGHALVGDALYGGPKTEAGFPLLHAARLVVDGRRVACAPPLAFVEAARARGIETPRDWSDALELATSAP